MIPSNLLKNSFIALIIFTLITSLFSASALASTQSPIKVVVNGKTLVLDAAPVIENGRTLVPLRGIFEALNSSVVWESKTQTVTATRAQTLITIQIGNNKALKNGSPVTLDVPAKIISGRTYVPLRFIGESFGSQVSWDSKTRVVTVVDKNTSMDYQQFAQYVIDSLGALQVGSVRVSLDTVIVARSKEFQNEVEIGLFVDYDNYLKLEQLMKQGKKAEIEAWLKNIGGKASSNFAKNEIFGFIALYDEVSIKPSQLPNEAIEYNSSTQTYELFLDVVYFDSYEGFIEVTWLQ